MLQVFLDYILFLKRLAAEANIKAQEGRERTLQNHHVNAVLRVSKFATENQYKSEVGLVTALHVINIFYVFGT